MLKTTALGALASGFLAVGIGAQAKVEFASQIYPILKNSCLSCHKAPYKDSQGRTKRPKAGLRLDGKGWILKGSKNGAVVVPGRPDKSSLYQLVILAPDDDDIMPAKGDPLSKRQTELIRTWIEQGCEFGSWSGAEGPGAAAVKKAQDAAKDVKLATSSIQVVEQLSKGVKPALPQAIQAATGRKCQVVSAIPGSPLLRVAFVSNEPSVGDKDLSKLGPLSGHITHLILAKTQITDAALGPVGRMTRLTRLDLSRTKVTDVGLPELGNLSELRYLNLHSTEVTDDGIQALQDLKQLESLYLWNSKVTAQGIERLRQALPRTKISFELDLPETDEPKTGASSQRRRRR